ncbi:ORF1 [Anelloviridae sp.]|nr:ORF1 [Anelloviridae sp.]
MAWGWWRRRRWPTYRRWRRWRRRRRLPRRRPRRAVRRYGKRRVRRRRWGRRRYRRGYRRRGAVRLRRRRRRGRKRLILTQWQPQTRRKCTITGYLPVVWCGYLRAARNYAYHSDDSTKQPDPFGGALSTTSFNLKVLYDQYQRGLNRWSFPNDQLDLARYKGCELTFYRQKGTDFIAVYDISAPYKLDKYSSPSYHPGNMIMQKKKILIPSYDTNPRGRQKVKVKIPPPKLFVDKWYAQEDLCDVNLLSLAVSAASFTHPFGSPLTNNPCVTFQVLDTIYYSVIGYGSSDEKKLDVLNTLYKENAYWASHLTPYFTTGLKIPFPKKNDPTTAESTTVTSLTTTGSSNMNIKIAGDSNYNWYPYNLKNKNQDLHKIRKQYFKWETDEGPQATSDYGKHHTWTTPTNDYYEYHLGLFSPIFIGPTRSNKLFATAYQDVTYNPLNDKAVGNKFWFQYNTKADTQVAKQGCYCMLENIPFWAAMYGYSDFIESELGPFQDAETVGYICVICPYTEPPMYNKQNPMQGYVFYDSFFGNGKWIDGRGHIEPYWLCRWRPEMLFQQQVMRDIVQTGPWSYKDETKNCVLPMKYKFKFTWGGNMVSQQTIRNPCKTDGQLAPSGRLPREVQIVDPVTMGPRWVFHSWDWRRGYLSETALRRLREKPLDYEAYMQKSKRPRLFPVTEGDDQSPRQEDDSYSEEEKSPPFTEEATETLQLQLQRQLRRQQRLGEQLQLLQHHLLKTQAGLQINPLLLVRQ